MVIQYTVLTNEPNWRVSYMCNKFSPDWLLNNIKATQLVLDIFKIVWYFMKKPDISMRVIMINYGNFFKKARWCLFPWMYTLHFLELVYCKDFFNLTKIFMLMLFKISANQINQFRLVQRSVMKFLVAEKCKLCEIYWTICDVYGEACFSQNSLQRRSK